MTTKESTMYKLPNGMTYEQSDIVNPDDLGIWKRCYLLTDHGFMLAIVFADCEQDAIDEAFDAEKLDRYRIEDCDRADYLNETGDDWSDAVTYLGNYGTPCDIESLEITELPMPKSIIVWE